MAFLSNTKLSCGLNSVVYILGECIFLFLDQNLLLSPSKITEIGTYMTVTKAHSYVYIPAPYMLQAVLKLNTVPIVVYGAILYLPIP